MSLSTLVKPTIISYDVIITMYWNDNNKRQINFNFNADYIFGLSFYKNNVAGGFCLEFYSLSISSIV